MTSMNQNENTIGGNVSVPKDQFLSHNINLQNRAFGRELTNFGRKADGLVDASKVGTSRSTLTKDGNFMGLKVSVPNENHSSKMNIEYSAKLPEVKEAPLKQDGMKNFMTKIISNEDQMEEDELDSFDLEEKNNPQYVVDYAREIFDHLRAEEEKHLPKQNYILKVQNDINEKMRGILVDWLVDVHLKFKLVPETHFLTVCLIDRYLSQVPIHRQKLQLVGVSAMLIASKYEEIYPPEVKDFEYVTDRAYTREEILEMEGKMLHCFNFNLTITSSYRFTERFARVAKFDERNFNITRYLLELSSIEYKMLKYTPSNLACSAIYLVNKLEKRDGWSDLMAKHTKYTEMQLRPCARDLCILLQNAGKSNLQAVKRKFSSSKYLEVSKILWDK